MIFLIEYNRSEGRMVTFVTFTDSARARAQDQRLALEIELNQKGIDHEVVLLEATSEDALRRTHRRYFEDSAQIVKSVLGRDR